MLIADDVKEYLGIDWSDAATDRRINHLITVAEKFLEGSLGVGFPVDDARVKELAMMIISDLYDNHDTTDKVSGNIRRLIADFSLQIRLEMRTDAV